MVLAGVWAGGVVWFLLVGLVGLVGIWELGRLYGRDDWRAPVDVLALAVLLPIGLAYLAGRQAAPAGAMLAEILVVPVAYGLVRELFRAKPHLLSTAAVAAVGVLYWGGFLAHLVLLRSLSQGLAYSLTLLAGTWGADIAAFAVGRRWGRRRLAPRLSPGKTVEGTVAGLLVGLAAAAAVGWAAGLPPTGAFLAGLAVVLATPLGDLVESGLKREAGVKDSGTLLPGHGGVLDRFDSLIMAGTVLYYVALFQQQIL